MELTEVVDHSDPHKLHGARTYRLLPQKVDEEGRGDGTDGAAGRVRKGQRGEPGMWTGIALGPGDKFYLWSKSDSCASYVVSARAGTLRCLLAGRTVPSS